MEMERFLAGSWAPWRCRLVQNVGVSGRLRCGFLYWCHWDAGFLATNLILKCIYMFFWNKQEWSPIILSRREWKEGRFREAGGICFRSAFQFLFPRECSAPVARGPALCCLLGGF